MYSDSPVRSIQLTSGTHQIAITKSWGWIAVDCLTTESADPIPDSAFEVSDELINPNANAETKALFTFLCDTYGKQVLSGQFADQGLDSDEFKPIQEVTGKTPSILGLDMMDYTPSRVTLGTRSNAVERGIGIHRRPISRTVQKKTVLLAGGAASTHAIPILIFPRS